MPPLSISPLPTPRTDDGAPPQAPMMDGFVDEAVVLAIAAAPLRIPLASVPGELTLTDDDLDFAGWRTAPSSVVPTPDPPVPPAASAPALASPAVPTPGPGKIPRPEAPASAPVSPPLPSPSPAAPPPPQPLPAEESTPATAIPAIVAGVAAPIPPATRPAPPIPEAGKPASPELENSTAPAGRPQPDAAPGQPGRISAPPQTGDSGFSGHTAAANDSATRRAAPPVMDDEPAGDIDIGSPSSAGWWLACIAGILTAVAIALGLYHWIQQLPDAEPTPSFLPSEPSR